MRTVARRKSQPGKTVLVVDDSSSIRANLRQLFLSDGFAHCTEAENGKQAIEVARARNPDVIILDLAMPVMNGIEAAPILRKLFPEVPIILFSLHGDYLKTQNLTSLGISATFFKTDSLDELLGKVHQLLGR
jgi:CheY-like chemotaxis protein